MSIARNVSFALGFGTLLLLACGSSQGDSCSADSDCGANLACQSIRGRTKNYCCPTPAEVSDSQNCHAVVGGTGATPTPMSPADAASGG